MTPTGCRTSNCKAEVCTLYSLPWSQDSHITHINYSGVNHPTYMNGYNRLLSVVIINCLTNLLDHCFEILLLFVPICI